MKKNLRGRIHKKLERGKDGEEPHGDKLEVTVAHVVHEVNVYDVTSKRCYGSIFEDHCRDQWYCEEQEIDNVFSEWMNHSWEIINVKHN